jgi:hypothetical protein
MELHVINNIHTAATNLLGSTNPMTTTLTDAVLSDDDGGDGDDDACC